MQIGDWSAGRMGVIREEWDLSVGASGIKWVLIGDRYALQSERVIFYPIILDQAIKIDRHWSGRMAQRNSLALNFFSHYLYAYLLNLFRLYIH